MKSKDTAGVNHVLDCISMKCKVKGGMLYLGMSTSAITSVERSFEKEVHRLVKQLEFIDYCNTPCWRYQC